jgi:hypothetical protein
MKLETATDLELAEVTNTTWQQLIAMQNQLMAVQEEIRKRKLNKPKEEPKEDKK